MRQTKVASFAILASCTILATIPKVDAYPAMTGNIFCFRRDSNDKFSYEKCCLNGEPGVGHEPCWEEQRGTNFERCCYTAPGQIEFRENGFSFAANYDLLDYMVAKGDAVYDGWWWIGETESAEVESGHLHARQARLK